jgi:hypothetical protein
VPVLELNIKKVKSYYVYNSPSQYVIVEADTIFKAMNAAGIHSPFKVLCQQNVQEVVFHKSEVTCTEKQCYLGNADSPSGKQQEQPDNTEGETVNTEEQTPQS